jgi:hypothetical protein
MAEGAKAERVDGHKDRQKAYGVGKEFAELKLFCTGIIRPRGLPCKRGFCFLEASFSQAKNLTNMITDVIIA